MARIFDNIEQDLLPSLRATLQRELRHAGVTHIEVATGVSADPYALACRFSPKSNNSTVSKADEMRVLICTDVLSEGQNLQVSNVVVNFDLPWAIIRNLYTEQQGILDDNDDEVDLASYAWQIWKQATQDDPDRGQRPPGLGGCQRQNRARITICRAARR